MTAPRVIVAGGGIAGLTFAFTLEAEAARLGITPDVVVVEAGVEAGGHACTIDKDGWLIEAGPNGFLDREPETMALVEELGLTPELVEASATARRRFVLRCGALASTSLGASFLTFMSRRWASSTSPRASLRAAWPRMRSMFSGSRLSA